MPRVQKLNPDDPEQAKRFIEMAREVEASEEHEEFERAFKTVSSKNKDPSKAPAARRKKE